MLESCTVRTNAQLRTYPKQVQGGDLPKIPGGMAIAYMVENAIKTLKNPKTSK